MRNWIALAIFVLLVSVATLPLRLALGWADVDVFLSASRVEGTVWNGRLRDARAHGLPLGDVTLALDIPSLVMGRFALHVAADGADMTGVLRRAANGAWRLERSH